MNRPRLFVSVVSQELGTARIKVAATVFSLGVSPVTQDDFPTGYRIRNAIERLISALGNVENFIVVLLEPAISCF